MARGCADLRRGFCCVVCSAGTATIFPICVLRPELHHYCSWKVPHMSVPGLGRTCSAVCCPLRFLKLALQKDTCRCCPSPLSQNTPHHLASLPGTNLGGHSCHRNPPFHLHISCHNMTKTSLGWVMRIVQLQLASSAKVVSSI